MTFYRNLIIFILIIAAIIAFLKLGGPYLVTPPAPAPAPTPVAQPAPPVEQPMAVSQQPARPTFPPPRVPVAAPTGIRVKLDAIARGTRVSIIAYREQGRKVNVTVQWVGDSTGPGGDFLDECVRQGILRDFKDQGFKEFHDRQGRRTYQAAYELYLN